jgi:hypothetical protein
MRLTELRNLGCLSSVEKFTVANIFVGFINASCHKSSLETVS